VFDSMKPIAQAEDTRGVGYVKAHPTATVRARYVALRWEPDFNPPSFVVDGVFIGSPVSPVTFSPGSGGPGAGAGGQGGGGGGQQGGDQQGGQTATGDTNGPFMTPFSNPFSISGVYASSAGRSPNGPPGRTGNPNAPGASP
jgi:hypothetical protein